MATSNGRPQPPRRSTGLADGTKAPSKKRKTLPKEGRPTPDDILTVLAALKDRDRELLTWLYVHRYATTDQLYRRFWSLDGIDQRKSLQNCRRRLWELAVDGLIAGMAYEQRSRAWCLDRTGLKAAQTLLRIPKEDQIPPDEWSLGSSSFLNHYVATTEIACRVEVHLIPLAEKHPAFGRLDALFRWESRRRMLWLLAPDRKGAPRYQYDDGRLHFRTGYDDEAGRLRLTGWTSTFLETDLNTEPLWQIEEKLDHYQAGFNLADEVEEGAYPDLAPRTNRTILFACNNAARATAIQALLDERLLPGLAVLLDDAPATLLNIDQRVEEHLGPLQARAERDRLADEARGREEAERRRQEEEARQERERARLASNYGMSKHDRYMAWNRYDVALSHYQLAEDEYVKKHKIPILKPEAQCRAEFRAKNQPPKEPAFERPDHWY